MSGRFVISCSTSWRVTRQNLASIGARRWMWLFGSLTGWSLTICSAPPALLEAQAIAARSYARAQLVGRPHKKPRDFLSDGTLDQAYGGEYVPDSHASE